MMKKKTYPARYPVKVGFGRSVVVGDYVFASGCSGQRLETFKVSSKDVLEQTEVALEKVRGALEEAGSSMNHIVKMVIYLTNIDDQGRVEEKCRDCYQKHGPKLIDEPPAQTVIAIPALHEPDLLVEIDATAVKKGPE
ncbi:MAG: RidA family protein [Deltaproteobacteria bacterium]|nr:RidA family protein [Deltaproteobacteria bacterium]